MRGALRAGGVALGLVWLPLLLGGSLVGASSEPPQEDPFAETPARHVVLISVDGLRPEFYLEDRWPAVMMRQMAAEGAHAKGVRGVHPSVTYPSHATLVTGALPARHGIFYNSPFDEGGQTGRWYWESEHLTTPALWDAVRAAGGRSASLWWPVTVGAQIDYNLPEVWPLDPDSVFTDAVRGAESPPGLLTELETQAVDRGIARIVEAAEEAGILDETTFIITGDHGFSDIHTVVAPNVWLVEAGFMEDRSDRGDWRATFHSSGASAFLKLRDPEDEGAVEEVRALLTDLPVGTRRLFQLIDGDRMVEAGADPDSPLSLSGVDGVSMTSARSGAAVRPGSGGTHGHFPDFPNMETGFVAWGAGVQAGARVPLMGMEDIAPVVVELLGLEMETPDGVLLPGLVEGR